MPFKFLCLAFFLLPIVELLRVVPSHATPEESLSSVVSVLPVWPNETQGGMGGPAGVAPEGSGIVLDSGLIATAWHVIEPATRINVRLADGRILPARLLAKDVRSDIAILGVDASLPPFTIGPIPELAQPVCAVGNGFGLGLSVTCGVVSARSVSNAGFNAVEDFLQTDAAVNPGMSGGALVDAEGRLVGMLSAIFASQGDTNIGINFAVSTELLTRVFEDLVADGVVQYPSAGWALAPAPREVLARVAAPVVRRVINDGPAAAAGIVPGDLILEIGARRVRTPRDAIAALAVISDFSTPIPISLERDGERLDAILDLANIPVASVREPKSPDILGDCPHPAPVCRVRQAVFPVSSFDPVGSATRIGPNLLVTNRHVVAHRPDAIVHTPDGPRDARVIPSAYKGDLVLLEVDGLPLNGFVPDLEGQLPTAGDFYVVGADIARKLVRVFDPVALIAGPAKGANLGRLHVHARMQPGVSGGALVDEAGELVGIAVGGGEGRFEAMPLAAIRQLLDQRTDPTAAEVTDRLGQAVADCAANIDAVDAGIVNESALDAVLDRCSATLNSGQLLEAGRILARAGAFEGARILHSQAASQVPNSINARISLLVSLQLSGRFQEMIPHARWLMNMEPDEPGHLRFAIQSGVWGDDPALAEEAYRALEEADPRQAEAARRFIDSAPPAPVRR